MIDLALIWAVLIAFAVFAYVVLDGFDLGIGILFPFFAPGKERDQMMNSVAPVWDGNETWLVLGGGGLFAAFPLAYATVMPALYAPIIAMLLGLVFRGVAFEYRWRTKRGRILWDWAFFGGSLVATLAQGIALGALVQGIAIENRAYAGGWWDWLTPFSLVTGVALVVGYVLLGSSWLAMKTTDALAWKTQRIAPVALWITVALLAAVSFWTPQLNPTYYDRWFTFPSAIFAIIVPVVVLMLILYFYSGLKRALDHRLFLGSLGLFAISFSGIGFTFYPYIVPPSLLISETAAPDSSLLFMLIGAAILLPLILAYTAYSYWVFRGRIDPEEGYH